MSTVAFEPVFTVQIRDERDPSDPDAIIDYHCRLCDERGSAFLDIDTGNAHIQARVARTVTTNLALSLLDTGPLDAIREFRCTNSPQWKTPS